MSQRTCTIKILDEVNCVFVGLHPDHLGYFYEEYGVFSPNYFFNPKYKLGSWDGKIRYFHKTGKTYVNLLNEIIPRVVGLGYKLKVSDGRQSAPVNPTPLTLTFFGDRGVWDEDRDCPWEMRPYQIELVNELMANGGGIGIAGTGAGKALSMDAKVLTPSGWVRNGDLLPGDFVVTPKGHNARIVDVFPQQPKQLYRITFHDGSNVECSGDHLWQVKMPEVDYTAKTTTQIVNTNQMLSFLERKSQNSKILGNISIPLVQPIEFPAHAGCVDPYVVGALIGDGCLQERSIMISSKDESILNAVGRLIQDFDVSLIHQNRYDYRITKNKPQDSFPPSANLLTEEFRKMGLLGKQSYQKFIPVEYKTGSVQQRLDLLRGLFDTDGTADKRGNVSFTTVSEQLAKDVQEVVWSIGGICTITSRTPSYSHNGVKQFGRVAYTCHVRHKTPKIFFSLTRKQDRVREVHCDGRIDLGRRVVSIEPTSVAPSQCIAIDDPEHLYITDDYIVTHNTSMTAALALAYELAGGLRSIIIVPDKNLTDQTVREYKFFGLDVGEYSGTKKDLNHQHVVSTWQALKNNPKIIQSFGVIVVDECHGLRGNILTKLLNEYGKDIPYRFGVTGTLPKEKTDELAVKVAVGLVQYEIPAHELIEKGYLAKLHIDIMQLEVNLKKQYDNYLNEDGDAKVTYKQFKDSYFPEWSSEKTFMQSEKERLDWIAAYVDIKRNTGKGNVLCLVNGIKFGKKLAAKIEGAEFIYGKDDMEVRKEIYARFKENDNLVVIATAQIASTGLDIKRIFNLIYIDVGKSFIRTIQAIGRGLRKAKDKDSVHVTDICSDLKYSKRHLRERIKFYKEARYPHTKKVVDYY